VKSQTYTSGTTYSLVDDVGDAALANELYRPWGAGPVVSALGCHSGRLVGGYGNRVYVSDFIPVGQDTDPYPRWANPPVEEADGWAFDIGAAQTEQVLACEAGDVLYILTDVAVRYMPDMSSGAVPVWLWSPGIVGPMASCYAEQRLFWAAHDGIYTTGNREEGRGDHSRLARRVHEVAGARHHARARRAEPGAVRLLWRQVPPVRSAHRCLDARHAGALHRARCCVG
jgi:hypothetical protein